MKVIPGHEPREGRFTVYTLDGRDGVQWAAFGDYVSLASAVRGWRRAMYFARSDDEEGGIAVILDPKGRLVPPTSSEATARRSPGVSYNGPRSNEEY